ncbi:MAG TPA: hypothetical protein VFF39_19170, partial [Verrucomicrobiae bacterium]|nr:hypothetical protein [Verrucomicrobiae bacterium]
MNQLYLPSKPVQLIFGRPAARRLISGARSIFFTASVSNPELAKHLEKKLGLERLQAYFGPDWPVGEKRAWGKPFDKDPWSFFRLIEDAALTRTKKEPWRCRLLVVPVESWVAVLKKYERDSAVQSFLLVLLAEYFLQSRNTRSEYLRQMVVSDKLATDTLAYASRTVHHLVELIRGEYPGFIPHDPTMGDDFGPYTVVYEEMHRLEISKFLESFPFLLRPVHFDQSRHHFVYYSFERPTLIAPVDEIKKFRSFRVLADKVKGHMQLLKKDRPGLLGSAHGAFFLSGGKPRGPGTRGSIEQSSYQVADTIEADFRVQTQHAKDRGWLLPTSSIFANTRWGFMNAFVRI